MKHFSRADLARQVAEALQGKSLLGDAHNGLFLAAPRRTGKSTFLQRDLKPELERQGLVVVYVDLWADPRRDPGELIADAIGSALDQHLGIIAKAVKKVGVENIQVAGAISFDTRNIGRPDGATLTDALRALKQAAGKPVVLIIDEAQHALTSEAGESVMAALKSARDQLNAPGDIQLMLIMSGSDRDKLLRLVNSNSAPFYGSQVQRMPALGSDFIRHLAELIEQRHPSLKPVDQAALLSAFEDFGQRPQFLMAALGEALSPFSDHDGRFESAVCQAARQRQADDEAQMASEYLSLPPLQQAVLWRLLAQTQRFRPYDAEALRFYEQMTGARVSAQKVQGALDALRQRSPSLVWKSARGEYAVEDAAMHRWYQQRVAAGAWPPGEQGV
ncbi:MAG: AAA family ATPase [Lautropia sp.]|nr:AAA family ATPase [Lautropia sp.]